MALRVSPITAQLAKLSLGISRTSIRFNQISAKDAARRTEIAKSVQAPGHGEKIWIFFHIIDGFTVYSHQPVLQATKALRQISFNGKKLKPSKFRKDYWQTLAMIGFPEGYGAVGRSVYQLLRECKMLHQLSWDDDMFYTNDEDTGKRYPRTKTTRGRKLNDMKTTTIADMAAVLGGLGKGNKIWQPVTENPEELLNLAAEDENNLKTDEDGVKALVKAKIWWLDDLDRNYAESWPSSVTHHRFDRSDVKGWFNFQPAPAEAPVDKPVPQEAEEVGKKESEEGEEGEEGQEGNQERIKEGAQEEAKEEEEPKTLRDKMDKENAVKRKKKTAKSLSDRLS
ncbi:transcriptional regulation of mitochondrial recombination-domain-containing protein [Annulohypoxylon truncatum]|uniref:transcriptional regulation of mitochondrial recombination-domain-containing protein n=1 Tax=Annulohypoxylon truncatum TaxID=327061 RepID=UPI0020072930|nr:transcriptional regulation of mitochondrial recombination-domain-containing protein [Annulohypoxylon truncatum]KAI1213015.1 transcriptional regulation of mitochondrial recombination-domain-containing protein [Annulohypoxylon truncatum]